MIYEALLDEGRLDTVELRRATRMSSPGSEGRFNRAMTDLQADFKILPVGVTQSGAWHYAFAYDIVARHYPKLSDQAHEISENEARQTLTDAYLRSLGAAQLREVVKLFGWRLVEAERAVNALAQTGWLLKDCQVKGQTRRVAGFGRACLTHWSRTYCSHEDSSFSGHTRRLECRCRQALDGESGVATRWAL